MPQVLIGLGIALLSAAIYNFGVSVQALDARALPAETALRISLFRRLLRRRRWVVGTLLTIAGWGLQTAALLFAPLTLVQPALASGLLVLLYVGVRVLGEHVGRREVLATLLLIGGIAGLAVSAPEHVSAHVGGARLAVTLSVLGLAAMGSFAIPRRRPLGLVTTLSCGFAFAWTGLGTRFLADAFQQPSWPAALVWFGAVAAMSGIGTLNELTAMRTWPATRVVPVVLTIDTLVPVLLAPLLLGEHWGATPGNAAAVLGSVALALAGGTLLATRASVASLIAADDVGPA
jgi:drug/metabolite transporter (DMT)-like permease